MIARSYEIDGRSESHNKEMGKSARWYDSRESKGKITHGEGYRR